jgi:hypothetical protein
MSKNSFSPFSFFNISILNSIEYLFFEKHISFEPTIVEQALYKLNLINAAVKKEIRMVLLKKSLFFLGKTILKQLFDPLLRRQF